MKIRSLLISICCMLAVATAADEYTNPILYADYSDPDAIRVGDEYYMTASSFNCSPGLPILHSYDLIHWEIIAHALPNKIPGGVGGMAVEHGNQVWAPSIRYHKKTFYITWGDPDVGIYQIHAKNPKGPWSEPYLLMSAKGYIDACPFWDDNGRTFIVHALAGSRAGLKSVLLLAEVNEDLTKVISPSQIIFDGHQTQPTCEGPKMYKQDGYYYIFFPAGGVATGWQTVLRSKMLYSQWEERIVMKQGTTNVNGPHQGAWVTTPKGESWFLHFQDVGALGRILHLQPMSWQEGWPMIGVDIDNDGIGEPVAQYTKPNVGKKANRYVERIDREIWTMGQTYPSELGPSWQWQAAPEASWYKLHTDSCSSIRLYSVPQEGVENLWMQPNLLLRKITGPSADYYVELQFNPSEKFTNERCGLLVFGGSYAGLTMENTPEGIKLYYVECNGAHRGNGETLKELAMVEDGHVWIHVKIESEDAPEDATSTDKIVKATFDYSFKMSPYHPYDGWVSAEETFTVEPGKWIGAKIGAFCTRPLKKINDGGWVDLLNWYKETDRTED